MIEALAALPWLDMIVPGLTILSVIGGILVKAYISPLKADIQQLQEDHDDQEVRLRVVEKTQAEHGVEISTVKEVTMKLVDRVDALITVLSDKNDK